MRTRKPSEHRAEHFLHVYWLLGSGRSLNLLRQTLGKLGVKISRQTLERYSSDFHWQARITQMELQAAEKLREHRVAETEEILELEFEIGKEMLNIVQKALQQMVKDNVHLSPSDVVRFAVAGAEIERKSLLGQQPSYPEEIEAAINSIIISVCRIFMDVNDLEDKEERKRRFAVAFNRAIEGQAKLLMEGGRVQSS